MLQKILTVVWRFGANAPKEDLKWFLYFSTQNLFLSAYSLYPLQLDESSCSHGLQKSTGTAGLLSNLVSSLNDASFGGNSIDGNYPLCVVDTYRHSSVSCPWQASLIYPGTFFLMNPGLSLQAATTNRLSLAFTMASILSLWRNRSLWAIVNLT